VATVGTIALFVGDVFRWLDVVDIYDGATDQWTSATLSQGRPSPATTTVGTRVFLAGMAAGAVREGPHRAVDIYDSATDRWTTATLSYDHGGPGTVATSVDSTALFAGNGVVDIYDSATDRWSTAALSQRRRGMVTASVGTTALFAGGHRWSTADLQRRHWEMATRSRRLTPLPNSDVVDLYHAAGGQ